MKETRILAVVLLLVFMFTGTAVSQSAGTISGTVTDSSDAVIPGAGVVAANQRTGVTRDAITDDSGRYSFPQLPIGNYTLTITMSGFGTAEVTDINLEVGQSRDVNVTLEVAQLATGVTVTAGAEAVDLETSDATLGQVIHSEQEANLPLNGRNFVLPSLFRAAARRAPPLPISFVSVFHIVLFSF